MTKVTPINPTSLAVQGLHGSNRPLAYLSGVFVGASESGLTGPECRQFADAIQQILTERLLAITRGERETTE